MIYESFGFHKHARSREHGYRVTRVHSFHSKFNTFNLQGLDDSLLLNDVHDNISKLLKVKIINLAKSFVEGDFLVFMVACGP